VRRPAVEAGSRRGAGRPDPGPGPGPRAQISNKPGRNCAWSDDDRFGRGQACADRSPVSRSTVRGGRKISSSLASRGGADDLVLESGPCPLGTRPARTAQPVRAAAAAGSRAGPSPSRGRPRFIFQRPGSTMRVRRSAPRHRGLTDTCLGGTLMRNGIGNRPQPAWPVFLLNQKKRK